MNILSFSPNTTLQLHPLQTTRGRYCRRSRVFEDQMRLFANAILIAVPPTHILHHFMESPAEQNAAVSQLVGMGGEFMV